ncbi:MAG: hypothetical protein IKK10_05240 [Clostridia bacterium]|nr:hypothetical protein [Clostridia bacterium]
MKKRKISPRHYKEEMYDTKRAVLSYEQLPLEDYNQNAGDKEKTNKKSLSYKKIILAVMVIILLVAIVFVVFSRFSCVGCSSYNLTSANYPLSLKGSLVVNGNFDTYSGGYVYVSDTHYVLCDNDGEEKFNTQVSFNDPVLKLNYNGTSVVYDLGGYAYSLYSEEGLVYSSQTESKMYLADVTPDLNYATVTESHDYKAKLSVYSNTRTPIYGYSFEEYYITAMALNSDATGAVACGVTAENGIEKSVVYVFDFTEENPLAFHEISGDIVFDAEYLDDGSLCVIGENASYIINGKNFSKLSKNSYSQMTLVSYDINTDTSELLLSLSRSGDGRNCTIQCIGKSGSVNNQLVTNYAATFTSAYKNRVAISDKSNIYLYSQNGELLSTVKTAGDSRQIRLISPDASICLGLKDISLYTF